MPGRSLSGFHRAGRYCVQHKERSTGGGDSFFVIPFWCGVFGHTAGLSSGLLLLMCYSSRNMETTETGHWERHRSPTMANGEYSVNMFLSFYRLTWVQRCWPRATPDFGSASVISSFLLQDIPRHPDTRLFEVREAFKRSLLLGFQAHICAYIANLPNH